VAGVDGVCLDVKDDLTFLAVFSDLFYEEIFQNQKRIMNKKNSLEMDA
jgi:hypothetical protein